MISPAVLWTALTLASLTLIGYKAVRSLGDAIDRAMDEDAEFVYTWAPEGSFGLAGISELSDSLEDITEAPSCTTCSDTLSSSSLAGLSAV